MEDGFLEFLKGIFIGLVFGFIVGLFVTINSSDVLDQHHELKKKCEKDLPRSQSCVMKLVPQGE